MIHFSTMIGFVLLLMLYSTTEADEQQYKKECEAHTSFSGSVKGFFYRETGQCFILHSYSNNWDAAQSKCEEVQESHIFRSGYLAKGHDVMTVQNLKGLVNRMLGRDPNSNIGGHWWFGGRNHKNCGKRHRPDDFRWISDNWKTTMEHSAWDKTQPHYDFDSECCVLFEISTNEGFHDYKCDKQFHFMCALEAKSCSKPASTDVPSNTNIYPSASKSFYLNGQTLEVRCKPEKWLLSGQGSVQTITCNSRLKDWDHTQRWGLSGVKNCYACTRPKSPSDTYTIETVDSAFRDGAVLTVRCKPSSWLDKFGKTEQTIRCSAKNDQWTGLSSLKKCYACRRPYIPPDSKSYVVEQEKAFKDGSVVMVSCDPDHSYNKEGNENQTLACNANNNEWTPKLSELKPCKKDCYQSSMPQTDMKLAPEEKSYSSGKEIQVHCAEGKEFKDNKRSKTVKCDNGEWFIKTTNFKEECTDKNKNARPKITFKKTTGTDWLKVLIVVAAIGGLATVVTFIVVGTAIFRAENYESGWNKDKAAARHRKGGRTKEKAISNEM